MADADVFVTVHRTADPIQAEVLADVLEQSGLDARVLSAPGAAVFGAGDLSDLRVEVRAAHAGEARELVQAYLASEEPALPESDDEEEADEAPEPERPPRLSPLLAAGVVPIVFGGGHFYARRTITGAAIAVGQVVAIVTAVRGSFSDATAAGILLCGLFAFDLVGGQIAVRAYNRGARSSAIRQLLVGGIVLFGMGAVATACAPIVQKLRLPHRQAADATEAPEDRLQRAGSPDPDQIPFPFHLNLSR